MNAHHPIHAFGVHYSDISALPFTAQHAPDPAISVAQQVSDVLLNSKFVLMSLRRATRDTDAPDSKVCSTKCRFVSTGKFSRLLFGLRLNVSSTLVPIKSSSGN
jgi:hypothetical protein